MGKAVAVEVALALLNSLRLEELEGGLPEGGLPLHSQEAQQAEGYGLEGGGSQHNGQRRLLPEKRSPSEHQHEVE